MEQQNVASNFKPLVLIGILFFTFGYITWTNGALIPILKIVCNLKTDIEAFLVTFAFYIAYTVLAIPSSLILRRTGFKGGMVLGLIIIAIGSLIFIPAAQARLFPLFLVGLFLQAIGLTILQTAVNPYVSILGPIESAARRISIMGICNKAAGIIAPLILGAVVLTEKGNVEEKLSAFTDSMSKNAYLDQLSGRMIMPYAILAVFMALVALLIWRSDLPDLDAEKEVEPSNPGKSVLSYPNLSLGILAIFFYVGAEVIAGDAIGQFGRNLGIKLEESTTFTAYTLTAMLLGYIVGIATIPKYLSQEKALTISAILGLLITIVAFFSPGGYTSIYLMASLGFVNAPMWPAIFPMGIKGLGRLTKTGSALLIMGICGGAVMPLVFARFSTKSHPQQGFWVIGICYLFIVFYALKGHKPRKENVSRISTGVDNEAGSY